MIPSLVIHAVSCKGVTPISSVARRTYELVHRTLAARMRAAQA